MFLLRSGYEPEGQSGKAGLALLVPGSTGYGQLELEKTGSPAHFPEGREDDA